MSLGGGSGVHRPPYHSAGQPSEPAGQRRVRGPGPIRAGQRRTAGTGTGTDPISDGVRGGRGRVTSRDREAGPDCPGGPAATRKEARPGSRKSAYRQARYTGTILLGQNRAMHCLPTLTDPTTSLADPDRFTYTTTGVTNTTSHHRPTHSRPSHQRHQRHQQHQWGTGQNSRPGR